MKKKINVFFSIVLLFFATSVFASSAYDWLCSQQYPTGLVDSYEGDNNKVAYTYDQACSIIAFLCEGDITRSKKILDKMTSIQNGEGSWNDAYYADTAAPVSTWRICGGSMWMIIAINYYTAATGDMSYISAAQKCADWLLELQDINTASDKYGSISGGLTDSGTKLTWASTEHNFDAYSALNNLGEILQNQTYKDRAKLVYNWLVNKMWDENAGRFYTGYNDYSEYLDPQSWSIVTIGLTGPSGQDFKRSINWANSKMRISKQYNGQTIEGLDYDATIIGTSGGIWFEGTEQMSLIYELLGDAAQSNFLHNETAKVQSANGGIMCALGDGPVGWPTNFAYNAAAPASWFIYCSKTPKINPFQLPSGGTIIPIISNIKISKITTNSVTISWDTNLNSSSQIEYGHLISYDSNTTENNVLTTKHSVTINGLKSNTVYHYKVKSKDNTGKICESSDNMFTTAAILREYAAGSASIISGSSSNDYINLQTNNSVYLNIDSVYMDSLYKIDWYAQTKIGDSLSNIAKLTVFYDGKYSALAQQELFLYNFAVNDWIKIDYRITGTSDKTTSYLTSDIYNYISPSGYIRLRVSASSTSQFTCYADYTKFRIELKSGMISAMSMAEGEIEEMPVQSDVNLNNGDCKLFDNIFNPRKNERVRLDFKIGNDGKSAVRIYNLAGELVRTLIDENRTSGSYTEYWDGKNDSGENAASGVYLVHFEAPGISKTLKAAIIK